MQNPLESYLNAADGAGPIVAHARRLIYLERLYQAIAPSHLGLSSHLANYKSGTVVIHAANGAVAAKLRQMAPSLADGFVRKGVECNGVQIKVQAEQIEKQSITSTQKPLSRDTCETLVHLRDSLPDTPLKEALGVLLDRAAKNGG